MESTCLSLHPRIPETQEDTLSQGGVDVFGIKRSRCGNVTRDGDEVYEQPSILRAHTNKPTLTYFEPDSYAYVIIKHVPPDCPPKELCPFLLDS